jgi:hypothetical protein
MTSPADYYFNRFLQEIYSEEDRQWLLVTTAVVAFVVTIFVAL